MTDPDMLPVPMLHVNTLVERLTLTQAVPATVADVAAKLTNPVAVIVNAEPTNPPEGEIPVITGVATKVNELVPEPTELIINDTVP